MHRTTVDWKLLLACLLLLLAPATLAGESAILPGLDAAMSGDAPTEERLQELEPVVVVGGFATPKIWKVSKGDHVMWVLGQQWVRADIQWRLDQLEARVAESQLVLYPGQSTIDVDVGFFRIISLIPAVYKTAKNPDKKTLKQVLPEDLYARWRRIKTRFVGRDDDIEKWRPAMAIAMLDDEVGKKLGPLQPATRPPVPVLAKPPFTPVIEKTAKKHKVKIRTLPKVEREVKIKNVRDMLKSVRIPTDLEVKCFAEILDFMERRIDFADRQAIGPVQDDAPVAGNLCGDMGDLLIKGMRSGEIPDPAGIVKVIDNVALQERLAREQRDAEWIAAAQAAIAKNQSTFTMLGMNQITGPTGYLAKLREAGYTVEEPD